VHPAGVVTFTNPAPPDEPIETLDESSATVQLTPL
jgi:hypothetical protein